MHAQFSTAKRGNASLLIVGEEHRVRLICGGKKKLFPFDSLEQILRNKF